MVSKISDDIERESDEEEESPVEESTEEVETSSGADQALAKGKGKATLGASGSGADQALAKGKGKATLGASGSRAEDRGAAGQQQAKMKSKKRPKQELTMKVGVQTQELMILVDVQTLAEVVKIPPLPNTRVVLRVPANMDPDEFLKVVDYAKEVGYQIHNVKDMQAKIAANMLVNVFLTDKQGRVEDDGTGPSVQLPPPAAEGTGTSEAAQRRSEESTSYSSSTDARSRGRSARARRRGNR